MKAKDILLKAVRNLPDDASALDAINAIELAVAEHEASMEALGATNKEHETEPAWLYKSPGRLTVVTNQQRRAA